MRSFACLYAVRTEKGEMKRIIQDFSGVERTTVEYQTWAAAGDFGAILVSSDKGVCSDNGTTVTVTFESVSLEVGDRAHNRS